jgi:long-chain acyl-CoA synthetase
MQHNHGIATLNHLFFHHLDHYRLDRLLSFQDLSKPGETMVWSTERFARSVFALRQFLLSCGLAAGDRVAVFAENRPEWHVADFAILLARLVVVPIYNTQAPAQIGYLLRHSGCRVALIAGARQWEILQPLRGDLPELETVVGLEETPGASTSLPRIVSEAAAFDGAAVERIRAEALAIDPQSLATIVYTSGTTGTPKGVMLSHGNLTFNLRGSLGRVLSQTARQALSVLPLAHVLERMLCYGYFHEGVPIAYGDPHDLKELLKLHRPEIMGAVPRILEKVREAVEAQVELLAPWRRAIGEKLIAAAVARARHDLKGEPAPVSATLLAPLAKLLVFPKVHRQLGGLQYFICGGAWLNPDVELFFRAAGFTVLQGYGLTETSPVITLNEYRREKLGSVGRTLDGIEVRIGADGEILTRGPHVMLGYYKDEAATRQTVDPDGWLDTGDLGRMDADGCVTITGRRKEILALSNGKKVACAAVEHALERSPYIQQALVVGDGRKFVSVLLVPHLENIARTARERGLAFDRPEELLTAPPIVALLREELSHCQAGLSSFEQAKRFSFLKEEALLDTELVTPTLKVRRAVLERKYAEWIGRMYQQEDPLVIPLFGQAPLGQTPLGQTIEAGSYKSS